MGTDPSCKIVLLLHSYGQSVWRLWQKKTRSFIRDCNYSDIIRDQIPNYCIEKVIICLLFPIAFKRVSFIVNHTELHNHIIEGFSCKNVLVV